MARGKIIQLAPVLSRTLESASGTEPSLSKDQRPDRKARVAEWCFELHSSVTHERFNAVLSLADYPDHDRATAAVIRATRDESKLVRLAAIVALGMMGPRIPNPKLRTHAVEALECIQYEQPELVMKPLTLKMLTHRPSWMRNAAGRSLLLMLQRSPIVDHNCVIPLAAYAADALQCMMLTEAVKTLDLMADEPPID